MLEIDEGILRPQLRLQLFTSDYFARSIEEQEENFKRLTMKLKANAVFAQVAGARIKGKIVKLKLGRVFVVRHKLAQTVET